MPLLAALLLTSCKDDDPTTDPIPEPVSQVDADMRGNWTNTFIKREYYSINDTLMHADSANIQAFFKFDGLRLTITLPNSQVQEVWNYTFPDKDNPNYIQLNRGSVTTDYIIKSLSDTEMVWIDETPWAGFPYNVPESQQTISKLGVFTYKFEKSK